MQLQQSDALFERARAVIPGGIAGIRAPENFVPGAYPKLLASGHGGRIRDVDDNEYIDLLLGYGPIILGHGEPAVDAAAAKRAADGFCLNLPQPLMIDLAERLTRLVPSAEQCLFFKTGSDATTAAVRLARAATGRRLLLRCGYHGWHDWCLEADPGVPAPEHRDVLAFEYNNADELGKLLEQHPAQVAGIILTPLGHDFDAQIEPPASGFLESVRALADAHGAVLIFDEVRTGFRVHAGGAQALYGVTPDLTALGKAMANGYAITALVGNAALMANAQQTFISSTYFPNSMEMAAAIATLDLLEREQVLAEIKRRGSRLRDELAALVRETSLPVSLSPFAEMPFLHFDPTLDKDQATRRDRFYALAAQHHVFAHPRHHGFLCWRHNDEDLARAVEGLRQAAQNL